MEADMLKLNFQPRYGCNEPGQYNKQFYTAGYLKHP